MDCLAMKDDAVEWADMRLPWLIWIHERWRKFLEGQVWLVGIELVVCPHPRCVKSG